MESEPDTETSILQTPEPSNSHVQPQSLVSSVLDSTDERDLVFSDSLFRFGENLIEKLKFCFFGRFEAEHQNLEETCSD